jgi:hypothetical protein
MSQNILQIFVANPITSNQPTDLMYFGRAPYSTSDDAAMQFSDFVAQLNNHLFTWHSISGTTQAASSFNGYVPMNSSLTSITLPATCSLGDVVSVRGYGDGGWRVIANTGQTIIFNGAITSTAGSISSAYKYDTVDVQCLVADNVWTVMQSVSSGLNLA